MLFQEALKQLIDGKCMSRKSWKEEDGYLVKMKSMGYVWKIITKPQPNAGNHIFSVDDLIAEDWEEYNEENFNAKEEKAAELVDAA